MCTGSDRQVTWWDAHDGTQIRAMEHGHHPLTALTMDTQGTSLIVGGADATVHVWKYEEGCMHAVSAGHSGGVTAVALSPDGRTIVAGDAHGGLFVWDWPQEERAEEVLSPL